jgi:hypothetical protein
MDLNQLNQLSSTDKARYAALEKAFESEGWKYITEVLDSLINSQRQRALSSPTWDATLQARAAMSAFAYVKSLPDLVEQEFTALASAKNEENVISVEAENE